MTELWIPKQNILSWDQTGVCDSNSNKISELSRSVQSFS